MPFPASVEEKQLNIEIGQKLRMYRQLNGLSQDALAAHIGVSYQQIQRYEKGHGRISAFRLQQIADVLNVSLQVFLDRSTFDEPLSKEEINLLRLYRQMSDLVQDRLRDVASVFYSMSR